MLEIGYVLDGKYKILNVVGRGGMSVVYLAMNEKANKQWAIKEVRKDGVKDFEVVKQSLIAEIDMLKRLDHPGLPSIVDVIEENDRFLIVMDYVQGNSLSVALEEYGAQPQELVIEWAKQLCDVLGYLHTRQPAIIYRDMKPANIMLKPDGNVTLIDFGTAREFKERNVADTTCLGTIGYAAPEQFGGMGQTDGRTDIYCLGTTLYHLVTGMNPCEPPYEIRPIRQINPSLSSGLEKIIMKCTRPNPDDRYQSAAELMYDLQHYEEIDEIYLKKQRRKVRLFGATAVAAVFCFISAGINYSIAESKMSDKYMEKIAIARAETEDSQKIDKYLNAMGTDPTREEAYNELRDLLIADGEISSEDYIVINKLTMKGVDAKDAFGRDVSIDALEKLKSGNKEFYSEFCLRMGKDLLTFYKAKRETDRLTAADNWFKYAINAGSKEEVKEEAEKYHRIVTNMQTIERISKSESADDFEKAYNDMWQNVLILAEDAKISQESKDYKLLTYKIILNILDEPKHYFDSEACTSKEMLELLDEIRASLEVMDSERCKEIINNLNLMGKIDWVEERINAVKKEK